jgi:hypothetical protein
MKPTHTVPHVFVPTENMRYCCLLCGTCGRRKHGKVVPYKGKKALGDPKRTVGFAVVGRIRALDEYDRDFD